MSCEATDVLDVTLAELGVRWTALRLCTPETQREMEHSLSRYGQLAPLLVQHGDSLEVIDGFKRVKAARALGWKVLRAEVLVVDGAGAKLRLWQSNAGRGLSELEEAWLVRALYREEGLTQPQIGQLLGRHKSWVCRKIMLAEGLSDGVQADVRLGLLSATVARELGRLPRGNQEQAAALSGRRGLTTRQVQKLVDELLGAVDATAREHILRDAQEWAGNALPNAGLGATKAGGARRTPGEWLIADTAAVGRLSTRLHARLLERSIASLGDGAAEVAHRSLHELRPGLLSLCRTIERVTSAHGVGHVELS